MQTGAWLLSGTDVESNLTYERLQQCLENEFASPNSASPQPRKLTRSKDDDEVQCLYNNSHRKRHSESPKHEHTSNPAGQYQYLILRNPPAESKGRSKSGDGILPGWMLRKRKSQPEMAVSSVQQPLPSISSPISFAQQTSTSDLINPSSAKAADVMNERAFHHQILHRKPSPLQGQQPKQQYPRYRQDIVTSPSRQSIDSTDSDGYEYVILRVPAKTRGVGIDPYPNTSVCDNNQITAKRLSTPEAQNLVTAIRAMKSSPSDPIVQVPKSPSPNKNYLNSSNWMPDNSGKYEYL
jgi:hypothetical protein